MLKIAKCSFCVSLIALSGCTDLLTPDAPPAPPLPSQATTALLGVQDMSSLQAINEHALFMQSMVALVATHSDRDFIKQFATREGDAYKKHQETIANMIKTAQISVPTTLNSTDQKRITQLTRLYSRNFDRTFLHYVMQAFDKKDESMITQSKKNGSTADMKTLAESALKLAQDAAQNGQYLVKY